MNDIKFNPGSSVYHSSLSESNVMFSSSPLNVKLGAVEEDISTRMMKSLAPSSYLGGSWTIIGVAADDISIVVTAWSCIAHESELPAFYSYAVISGYL